METTTKSRPLVYGLLLVLLVICCAMEASAKRGCSAFGHSCFGGHGKRSDSGDHRVDPVVQDNEGDRDTREDYEPAENGGEVILADVGQIYQDRPMPRFQPLQLFTPQQQHPRYNLSPFIRQWLASYRRANSDEFQSK